jgi:hypothetical protein
VTAEGAIRVDCAASGDGWTCDVVVGEDPAATRHRVTVRRADLDRLAPGSTPDRLVEASFGFLLEREPRTSILREFDVTEIGRYFSEYAAVIGDRIGAS